MSNLCVCREYENMFTEGYKYVESLEKHDAKVRADVIKVCAKEMSKLTGLCQRACPIHCEWGEAGSCEKSWEEYFMKKVKEKQR